MRAIPKQQQQKKKKKKKGERKGGRTCKRHVLEMDRTSPCVQYCDGDRDRASTYQGSFSSSSSSAAAFAAISSARAMEVVRRRVRSLPARCAPSKPRSKLPPCCGSDQLAVRRGAGIGYPPDPPPPSLPAALFAEAELSGWLIDFEYPGWFKMSSMSASGL